MSTSLIEQAPVSEQLQSLTTLVQQLQQEVRELRRENAELRQQVSELRCALGLLEKHACSRGPAEHHAESRTG